MLPPNTRRSYHHPPHHVNADTWRHVIRRLEAAGMREGRRVNRGYRLILYTALPTFSMAAGQVSTSVSNLYAATLTGLLAAVLIDHLSPTANGRLRAGDEQTLIYLAYQYVTHNGTGRFDDALERATGRLPTLAWQLTSDEAQLVEDAS